MGLLEDQIEGKYEILEKIKEGGMGSVYKVRHRFLDEIRVVKVIRSSLEASNELADRFQREARAAIRLRHPNIAQLHDFAVGSGGTAYIVMEYIDGLTLEDTQRVHGVPPLGLTLEIASQSLKAIGYLHRRGFVHRDIAPDNLMLTRGIEGEPLVKLIDLGIAKVLAGDANVTSTGTFLGKPRYASPEHFGADGGIDGRSDLYSFGIVLYELLTGQVPVLGHDPASFMAGHLLRPPRTFAETDPHGRVPNDLRELLLQALAKRSSDRLANAEEFARQLAVVQARYPIGAGDLEAALQSPPAVVRPAASLSGSTQDRLNAQFGVAATPAHRRGAGTTDAVLPQALESLSPADQTQAVARSVVPQAVSAARPAPPLLPAVPAPPSPPRAPDPPVIDTDWGDQTLRPGSTMRSELGLPSASATRLQPATAPREPKRAGWGLAVLSILVIAGAWFVMKSVNGPPPENPERLLRAAAPPPAPLSAPAPAPAGPAGPEPRSREDTRRSAPSVAPPLTVAPTRPVEKPPATESAPPRQRRDATASSKPVMVPDLPGAKDPSLITAGPGVELAEPTSIPEAVYPAPARGSGLHPQVILLVLVDAQGNVSEARIKSGDASGLGFNEAALAAVKRARFLPATRDGVPGRSWTELGVEFSEPQNP